MTAEEFDLIAKLIRSRGHARDAARLVLVEGKSNAEAMVIAETSYTSVVNTVSRFRSTHAAITSVFGKKKKSKAP